LRSPAPAILITLYQYLDDKSGVPFHGLESRFQISSGSDQTTSSASSPFQPCLAALRFTFC